MKMLFYQYDPIVDIRLSNLQDGLCAACWAHFMCHPKLWPTSVSHPFSSLNSSIGFAGGKRYLKNTVPFFRLVLQNFALPGCFPYILFCCYLFSLLSSDSLLSQSVALFQSGSKLSIYDHCKTGVELPSPMRCQLNGCPHFLCFFFIYLFFKLIVACVICVMCLCEDNDLNI